LEKYSSTVNSIQATKLCARAACLNLNFRFHKITILCNLLILQPSQQTGAMILTTEIVTKCFQQGKVLSNT
jgi:hypothetical protein